MLRRRWDRPAIIRAAVPVAVVLVGLALRIWILSSSLGPVDSDEAAGGLIARHLLHGEGSVFLWGNNYGGTLEAILTAPLFALFGSGMVMLKIVPMAAFAGACVLTWRIGLRTVGPPGAFLGAALLWVASGAIVVLSTKARLYYGMSLLLACAAVLLCLRLAERPSRADMAVLGLVAGLGLWTAPFVFYVAVPILAWLFVTRPRRLLDVAWAVPGALVGAAPWLSYNLRTGWQSFHEQPLAIPIPSSQRVSERFAQVRKRAWPRRTCTSSSGPCEASPQQLAPTWPPHRRGPRFRCNRRTCPRLRRRDATALLISCNRQASLPRLT